MKAIRIFLLILIIAGIILLITQSYWVPKLVSKIILNEGGTTAINTNPPADCCTNHFLDTNNIFTFDYNSLFTASPGSGTTALDWRLNATGGGFLLATVTVPRSYMPGTNFSEARLSVGSSNAPSAIDSCTKRDENGETAPTIATLSGHPFSKFNSSDAGAGNFYETVSYRGIFEGDCYAIEYTIHSTNIGNYSPDQGIKEFDKSKITRDMEKIINSFKFLLSSD